jgi:hypothetical protein
MTNTTEREVLPPALAQRKAAGPAVEAPAEIVSPDPVKTDEGKDAKGAPKSAVKFVKNFCVADVFKFKDGTEFSFRQINRSTDFGVHPNSFVVTEDEKLIENLRQAAKNPYAGIVEVTA